MAEVYESWLKSPDDARHAAAMCRCQHPDPSFCASAEECYRGGACFESGRWVEIRDESPNWPGSGYSHAVQIEALCKRIAEWERVAKTHGAEPTPEGLAEFFAKGAGDD